MTSAHARFASKTRVEGDCLVWVGAVDRQGYGRFYPQGRGSQVRAHRWAYEQLHGDIPRGLVIDHLCRRPACVLVAHLEAVTNQENLRRGVNACRERTHCPNGHAYDEANTYQRRDRPGRECRACALARYHRTSAASLAAVSV